MWYSGLPNLNHYGVLQYAHTSLMQNYICQIYNTQKYITRNYFIC